MPVIIDGTLGVNAAAITTTSWNPTNLVIPGNSTIGDASTDTLTVNAVPTLKTKLWMNTDSATTSQNISFGDGTTTYAQISGSRDSATTGHLDLYTLNSGALTSCLTIDSTGRIAQGTVDTRAMFNISQNTSGLTGIDYYRAGGAIPTSAALYAISFHAENTSPASSSTFAEITLFKSQPATTGANSTITTLTHFSAVQPTLGVSSTITTQYGFYGNISSGTGKYNFYASGTADNYLAGNLLIGTTTTQKKLTISSSSLDDGIWVGGNPRPRIIADSGNTTNTRMYAREVDWYAGGIWHNLQWNGAWALDDSTKPGWSLKFSSSADDFNISRVASGSTTYKNLFTINGNGDVRFGDANASAPGAGRYHDVYNLENTNTGSYALSRYITYNNSGTGTVSMDVGKNKYGTAWIGNYETDTTKASINFNIANGGATASIWERGIDIGPNQQGNSAWTVNERGIEIVAAAYKPVIRFHRPGLSEYKMGISSDEKLYISSTYGGAEVGTVTQGLVMSRYGVEGIRFAPDTVNSADANTLDDYEEGYWTPVLYGDSTAGTFTPGTANGGRYVKIGNIVTCWANCNGVLAGATGYMRLSGLPFTTAANGTASKNAIYSSGSTQYWDGSGISVIGPLTPQNNTTMYWHSYTGFTNSASGGQPPVVNTTHNLHFHVTYYVTA